MQPVVQAGDLPVRDAAPTPSLRTWAREVVRATLDVRALLLVAVAAAGYVLAARVSLFFVLEPQNVAGIWPSAGIALAALLLTRTAQWPLILLAIGVSVAVVNRAAGVPAGMTAGFVLANTLEPLVAAMALRRGGFTGLGSVRGVAAFVAFGVLLGPAVGATVGAISATVFANAPVAVTWITWLLGDSGGVMTVTPLILVAAAGGLRPSVGWGRAGEGLAFSAGILGLGLATFTPLVSALHLAAYPEFLLVVAAAVRFGTSAAALATFALGALAIGGTIAGYGPMAELNAGPAIRIGQTQIFVAVVFLSSFVTAAAWSERRAALTALATQMASEAERVARRERLTGFARDIGSELQPGAVFQRIAHAAAKVVPADIVQLTAAVGDTDTHEVMAGIGAPDAIGRTIDPGDGVTGAVIRDRIPHTMLVTTGAQRAKAMRDILPGAEVTISCAPIIRDDRVVGTLGLARFDVARAFDRDEIEAIATMAELSGITISNANAYDQVHDRSIRDSLTGVPNRRYFDLSFDQLAAQRERQPAEERPEVSAILFDLDHFGAVNKERGHETGDRVLAAFGRILASRLRRADIVARYGGEEFIAVLVGTGLEGALVAADSVRSIFEASTLTGADGKPIRVTVSAGVATVAPDDGSVGRLITAADVALSMAKRAGRNQVVAA